MSFLKKIFSSPKPKKEEETSNENINLHLDENFVQNFTNKNGKFLYCTHQEEVNKNLMNILQENAWEDCYCIDNDLQKLLFVTNSNTCETPKDNIPFFTTCENLIANDGSILFTSNQLGETKLIDLPVNFIVFAKTSQLLSDKGDALISIKSSIINEIPTNIGAIKCYDPNKKDDDFMNYGNNNAKNLYLLLLEDL